MISLTVSANPFHYILLIPALLHDAGWSFFFGILAALLFVAIIIACIKGFIPKFCLSNIGKVTALFAVLLLTLQFTPVCAALSLKSKLAELSSVQSYEMLNTAIEKYPIIGDSIKDTDYSGYSVATLANTIIASTNSKLNNFILKMLAVAIVEMIVCTFIIVRSKTVQIQYRQNARRQYSRRTNSGGRRRPSASRALR